MEKIKNYFDRIAPIVGDHLRNKTIIFYNLRFTFLIADSFVRCGVKSLIFIDRHYVSKDDIFCRTYGNRFADKSYTESFSEIISNDALTDFDAAFIEESENIEYIIEDLSSISADIIIGGGTVDDILRIEQLGKSKGIPSVSFMLFDNKKSNGAIFIRTEEHENTFSEFLSASESAIGMPEISPEYQINWLDICDDVMKVSRAIILRGTDKGTPEIEDLIFNREKYVILRGDESWPWNISYVNPVKENEYIRKKLSPSIKVGEPLPFFQNKKIMIIGCGTASLLVRDIANYFQSVILIDCKPFSIYNPVRQWVNKDEIEKGIKSFVLAKKLADRISTNYNITYTDNSVTYTITETNHSFVGINLNISEQNSGSSGIFENYLELFKPDIVVVGMGRSQDDNFLVSSILRKLKIKHVIPTAFPAVTHFKTIIVDGEKGPCYECLNSRLVVDYSQVPILSQEARDIYYGGTQPATVMETLPSVHVTMRLILELLKPNWLQNRWFMKILSDEKTCLVGGNRAINRDEKWLYGISVPGQVVVYGTENIVDYKENRTCTCGRVNRTKHIINKEY